MSSKISKGYIAQNQELMARKPGYATAGHARGDTVLALISEFGAQSVLDYGAGRCRLHASVKDHFPHDVEWNNYDPCIPELAKEPQPADLVVCTDVMEHVEPSCVHNVLLHLAELTLGHCWLRICPIRGKRRLPNGQFAHCSVHPPEEWRRKLQKAGFVILRHSEEDPRGYEVLVAPVKEV